MSEVIERRLPEVRVIELPRIPDERGFLAELYHERSLAAQGIAVRFVQDNFSFSPRPFTVRGLHFQTAPHAQAKFVRIIRGAALNVAVGLRRLGLPTTLIAMVGDDEPGEHIRERQPADRSRGLQRPATGEDGEGAEDGLLLR